MKKINIKTSSKEYQICIGNNLTSNYPIGKIVSKREVLIISDKKVPKKLINGLKTNLSRNKAKRVIEKSILATEKNKSLKYISKIYDFMLKEKLARDCLIIGLGGGITCDITGFISSTYQRGVDFVLIPTTLLSQVDASIGGKTGVNHMGLKNMVGTFYQPSLVLVDTASLKSLPKKEILCGLIEVIKHGIIKDGNFFNWLEKNIDSLVKLKTPELDYAIKRSIEIKADVVSVDEKESGLRAILNFGHTFGHAIETIGNNKDYSHGEAVALGMIVASKLSQIILGFSEEEDERILSLLKKTGISTTLKKKVLPKKLLKLTESDKKKKQGRISFILIERIGKAKITKVENKKTLEKVIERSLVYSK